MEDLPEYSSDDMPDELKSLLESIRKGEQVANSQQFEPNHQKRELNITQDAKQCDVFDRLWDNWKSLRAYCLSEDGKELVQRPLSRPGYPDSGEDCDVILGAYRHKREGESEWRHYEGILRLEWVRNIKKGCQDDPYTMLASISPDEALFVDSLTPEGRGILEQSRQKLLELMWRDSYNNEPIPRSS